MQNGAALACTVKAFSKTLKTPKGKKVMKKYLIMGAVALVAVAVANRIAPVKKIVNG